MAFNGRFYTVTFDQIRGLMYTGTEIIVVEKYGTVVKLVPFTENNGVAFLESQGFVSEYGIALARIAAGQCQIANIYTNGKAPSTSYAGNLVETYIF